VSRARNYLARGRSVDSIKRGNNLVPLGQNDGDGDDGLDLCRDVADPIDLRSELITRDIVDLLVPRLTDMQQQILFLLMHGFGVREIARQLRVSHPVVIKHRRKMARIASDLLADTGCIGSRNGSQGNSLVTLDPTRYHMEKNGKETGNAVGHHESMPDRMVAGELAPGVETDPRGASQTAHPQ